MKYRKNDKVLITETGYKKLIESFGNYKPYWFKETSERIENNEPFRIENIDEKDTYYTLYITYEETDFGSVGFWVRPDWIEPYDKIEVIIYVLNGEEK